MKNRRKILLISFVIFITLAFPYTVSAEHPKDDRTIFGETYTLESDRILDGDLNVIGGIVEIEKDAKVNGNVLVIGGLVTIDGVISGDLTALGGTVNLEENAVVRGNLISPGSYINQHPDAVVEGDRIEEWTGPWNNFDFPTRLFRSNFPSPEARFLSVANQLGKGIAFSLIMTGLGALLLLLMPKSAKTMTDALETQPWLILGFGALTAMVMVVGGVILAITICLIPIVILAALAFSLAMLIGWLSLGYEIGKKISSSLFNASWHPVLSAAVGNLALYLIASGLDLIPCLGSFLVFVGSLFGLGTAIVTLFGTKAYPRAGNQLTNDKVVLHDGTQPESNSEWKIKKLPEVEETRSAERPIEDLDLSEREITFLKDAGLKTIDDVVKHLAASDETPITLDGFNQESVKNLKDVIRNSGYDIPGSSE